MDKQLERVDARAAGERYRNNLPVSLKQLAVALGVGYEQVRTWAGLPGFPYEHRAIFPEDFRLWRQRRLGLVEVETAPNPRQAVPVVPPKEAAGQALAKEASRDLPPHVARMVTRALGTG